MVPGRYDEKYEQKGIDYPLPYVRWTEKRNFEAVLNAISTGRLDVKSLVSEIVPLCEYNKIYKNINNGSIASILSYPDLIDDKKSVQVFNKSYKGSKGVLGIIGAGNFTGMVILPAFKKLGAEIKYICSSKGLSGTLLAKKYNISYSSTDYNDILNDSEIDSVLITTRHNQHANLVIDALKAGKNVFVEKPLALNKEQLHSIIQTFNQSIESGHNVSVMVGFNRRFSPFIIKAKELIASHKDIPINVIATMNAGFIPQNVWVQDMEIGGGRIIGEACHYVDLITYLTGSKVSSVSMNALGNTPPENSDNVIITLKYENGSQGVINYFSNGSNKYSKERIEIYGNGKTLVIDNFREMRGYGINGFRKKRGKQDKGHYNQFKAYLNFLKNGGEVLIPFDDIVNTTLATFTAIESLKTGRVVKVG